MTRGVRKPTPSLGAQRELVTLYRWGFASETLIVAYDLSWKTLKTILQTAEVAIRKPGSGRRWVERCKWGHELSGQNLWVRKSTGQRCCRVCLKKRQTKYLAKDPEWQRFLNAGRLARVRNNMTDGYICGLLFRRGGVPRVDIPSDLIEAKRDHLKQLRLFNKLKESTDGNY